MRKTGILISIWFLFSMAAKGITTMTNASQLFQFKFDPNRPLIYAVDYKFGQRNDSEVGQRSSVTRTTIDTRYKVKFTSGGTNEDGTTAVFYAPFDYEQDSHTLSPSGDIDLTTRGLTIVSKQNGIVMVDTEKGIGASQWQNMKQAVYPHLLSGYMDFEPTGRIKEFEGDPPFIDTWQNLLKDLKDNMTLLYIVFPTNMIAINDTWTNYYRIKTCGPVVFDGKGIPLPWGYVREPDQATTNGPLAIFSLNMSASFQNLGGHIDQFGQQTAINVRDFTETRNASFQFDQKRGCLISMRESDNLRQNANMVIQGNPAAGHGETETRISITLISP